MWVLVLPPIFATGQSELCLIDGFVLSGVEPDCSDFHMSAFLL